MKIFYAVQATGNGHISRAKQLLPYLNQFGTVDVFLSGSNATLENGLNPTYKSGGISLFYKKCGGLNYLKMVTDNGIIKALKDAKSLPVEKYDVVINDFDFITARACRIKKVKSIQFGHQASFMSDNTPRPKSKSWLGESVLTKYAVADQYLGLHFQKYDSYIYPPVIKKSILESSPKDMGHITVYLPSYNRECLENHFRALRDIRFDWFLPGIKQQYTVGNITYNPISDEGFTYSLINCHGIITGGGFETPAEALYLKKKLMSIPIRDHYEQACNAAAIEKLGGYVLDDIDDNIWQGQIREWLELPPIDYTQEANDVNSTLEYLFDTY